VVRGVRWLISLASVASQKALCAVLTLVLVIAAVDVGGVVVVQQVLLPAVLSVCQTLTIVSAADPHQQEGREASDHEQLYKPRG
jgi:hypothetical protein